MPSIFGRRPAQHQCPVATKRLHINSSSATIGLQKRQDKTRDLWSKGVSMIESIDQIERQIDIAASAERVWELIRRPGWWINEGTIVDVQFDADCDVNVIRHPKHGDFRIKTVALDEPRHAAFRWLAGAGNSGGGSGRTSGGGHGGNGGEGESDGESNAATGGTRAGEQSTDGDSTLVEFWIEDTASGVSLRVVESGFASLSVSSEERRKRIEGNTEGWTIELAAARDWVGRS
jgi:uncharacterized protein YndB with AHSA1/START domain